MSNIRFGTMTSGIDYDAIEATKEAIFKRARAKAEEINKTTQGSFTSDLKNDVMKMARESIKESPGNPFKEKDYNQPEKPVYKETGTEISESEKRLIVDNNIPAMKKVGRFDNKPYKLSIQNETMAQARNEVAGYDRLGNLLSALNSKVAFQNSAYKPANFNRYS